MIKTIAIIGFSGGMGQMFARDLKKIGKKVLAINRTSLAQERERVLKESDMVIISIPIEKTPAIIDEIKAFVSAEQLVTDFTSVKARVVPQLKKLPSAVISAHPLFGPMKDMKKQKIILLPINPKRHLGAFSELWESLGLNTVIIQDWEKHDEYMSFIQGVVHFLHIIFTSTLRTKNADLKMLMDICSPVYQAYFAFSSRIMGRDPNLYAHILSDNPMNISALEELLKNAQSSFEDLSSGDEESFIKTFKENKLFLGDFVEKFTRQSDYLVKSLKEL